MNKVVGLVGAISGLATLDGAQAASLASPNTTGLPPAQSFAELLEPIPNALAVLQAMDADAARSVQEAAPDANVTLVQYHHHHHHRWWRHHHHHHRWWRRHHHHHHHHHRSYR